MSDDDKTYSYDRDSIPNWPREVTRGPRDNSEVRMYIRTDCSAADAQLAFACFNSFFDAMVKELPNAQTVFRQGERAYILKDGDEDLMFVRPERTANCDDGKGKDDES